MLEICLKWRSGKLQLPNPPRSWVHEQAEIWKLQWLPLIRSHMFRASELEPLHQDPYNELLLARSSGRRDGDGDLLERSARNGERWVLGHLTQPHITRDDD